MTETYDKILEGKLMLAVIQIFDWAIYYWPSGQNFIQLHLLYKK